jgi:hypothetical protein
MQPTAIDDSASPSAAMWKSDQRAAPLLPLLLVAASFLADLVAFCWHTPRSNFPTTSAVVYFSLAFSQISLATIWASLAPSDRFFHAVGAASAISLLLLALMYAEPIGAGWFVLVGIHVVGLAGPLMLSRRHLLLDSTGSAGSDEGASCIQFSLQQIFVVVSCAAIVLGLLRVVSFAAQAMIVFCSFGLLFATIGWTSVWAIYGKHPWPLRLLTLLTFAAGAGGLTGWLVRDSQFEVAMGHAALNLLQSLLVAGSLLVLRVAGYRLAVATKSTSGSPNTPADTTPADNTPEAR